MKKMSKIQSERVHAKRRCWLRYGESINRHDLRHIVGLIQSGDETKAVLVEKQSLRVSLWRITFRDRLMRVVYDKQRHTIVSFLPLESRAVEWPKPNAATLADWEEKI